jgi:predicted nucleic acid-binding OB-fold protein
MITFAHIKSIKIKEMAKIRNLKKDVRYLTSELISEVLTYKYYHPELTDEKLSNVISDIIDINNDMLVKINNIAEPKNPKLVKKYFAEIREGFDTAINKLDELTK